MRPSILLPTVLLLTLGTVARAADDPPVGDTAEEWVVFSRAFEKRLLEQGRSAEAVQEMIAQGLFAPDDAQPWIRAAYWSVIAGEEGQTVFMPGAALYAQAERCLVAAIASGAGPDENGKVADARIPFVIGRLRFVDGSFAAGNDERTRQMLAAVEAFGQVLDGEDVEDFEVESAQSWFFRSAVNASQGVLADDDAEWARRLLDIADERGGKHPDLSVLDLAYGRIARAEVHRKLKEHSQAERLYRQVIVDLDKDPRGYLGLGRVLMDQNKLPECLQMLGAASDLARQSQDTIHLLGEALLTTANALVKFEPPRLDEAEQALKAYFYANPDHPDGLYVKGLIAMEREQWAEARKYFRWVNRREPDDIQCLRQLVKVLYELGDDEGHREAMGLLKAAQARARGESDTEQKDDPPDEGTDGGE